LRIVINREKENSVNPQ